MSLRSSLRRSSLTDDAEPTRQYIQRLAVLYDDQHQHAPAESNDGFLLKKALQQAGEHSEGIGAVEVYRYRERLGDLLWLDQWRKDSNGEEERVTNPVVPGTGLVGTIWSSQTATKRQQSRSVSSSVGVRTETPAAEATNDPPQSSSLVWRCLKTIDLDPDTWQCARVQQHLRLGLTKAAGVFFESDGVKGVVVYYHTQDCGVKKERLNALTNTVYMKRCASYIGSMVAMTEARHACLIFRESNRNQQKETTIDEESHIPAVATEKLESFVEETDSSCVDKFQTRVVAWYNKCWGGGLQIPPPMELQQVAWTWCGAFCGLLTLSVINELFVHLTESEYNLVIGPFGAMMTLLYALPSAPASQPRNVILGEVIAGGVSMSLAYLPIPKWARRAVTPAFGIAAMTACGVVHPPAGAHATIWADQDHNWAFYLIVVFCSVVSVIPATIINNMSTKRSYPTYWGYLPKWLYRKVFGTTKEE